MLSAQPQLTSPLLKPLPAVISASSSSPCPQQTKPATLSNSVLPITTQALFSPPSSNPCPGHDHDLLCPRAAPLQPAVTKISAAADFFPTRRRHHLLCRVVDLCPAIPFCLDGKKKRKCFEKSKEKKKQRYKKRRREKLKPHGCFGKMKKT